MTTTTLELPPTSGNPWDDGYTAGELAAHTGLSSRRLHAQASVADPLYAQGLADGYLSAIHRKHVTEGAIR